jgi:hypothetical protein
MEKKPWPEHETRIKLTDTPMDIVVKMAEGNPGAVTVMSMCLLDGGKIDPDSAFGGLACLLDLDTLGIYGSKIWILFKDICGQNMTNFVGVLRAWQLGAISDPMAVKPEEVAGLLDQVRAQLPEFGKNN